MKQGQKLKRWTEQEDAVLLKCLADNAEHIALGLDLAAKKLGRNKKACSNRYYGHLKSKNAIVPTVVSKPKPEPKSEPKAKKSESKSKSKCKRWTKEEDNCLRNQVVLNINCLEDAFTKTARLTGRSIGACRCRWYYYVSIQPETKCFALVSQNQQINNRRFPSRPSLIEKKSDSWWKKIFNLLWPTK